MPKPVALYNRITVGLKVLVNTSFLHRLTFIRKVNRKSKLTIDVLKLKFANLFLYLNIS